MSQTALADALGVSFQQVQKYEGGTNRISASRLHAIAVALAAAPGDFFPPGAVEAPESAAVADQGLTPADQRAQAARCPCRGADEWCPCQNTPDRQTMLARRTPEHTGVTISMDTASFAFALLGAGDAAEAEAIWSQNADHRAAAHAELASAAGRGHPLNTGAQA